MAVKRLYVEKIPGIFDVPARHLYEDLQEMFSLTGLKSVRIIRRYDIEGLSDEEYEQVKPLVFYEPPVDNHYDEELPDLGSARYFAIEPLPGQFDQTADSAAQCIQLITQKERPLISTAQIIILNGEISDDEYSKIINYCINPIEARQASMDKPVSLQMDMSAPANVEIINSFIDFSSDELAQLKEEMGMAMSLADLEFCQRYFRDEERRNPTITEIRVIDTYWSDHCRHTTFMTEIDNVQIQAGKYHNIINHAYQNYLDLRKELQREHKPECLMDIATMGMRALKAHGKLQDLDISEEINACSIVVPAIIDGNKEDWLVMFKNETHNHPTEIEPFGGAATCLGGAIRDPLSGRSYVYQAMRVTGAGDPRRSLQETIAGKLPQRKITRTAAKGYSSYGNQIGLATGKVQEIYHDGYIAKRMEIGAVVAAAPKENVVREVPQAGDKVILVGGGTGRDGIGGATGSSKEHTEDSLMTCGAEVQKGNPPTERKLQRLFRISEVAKMIKRCNDFGAGGVAVAIGELTDGLVIDLDKVPKKYLGLDGTEIAISESQERIAVVVAADDVDKFIAAAALENLEAVVVASVTDNNRLIMKWRDTSIVDIARSFLQTNGVSPHIEAMVQMPQEEDYFTKVAKETETATPEELSRLWMHTMADLNVCSQKGLAEQFDSTIGAGTVLMPFGGKTQLTPTEAMVAKLPLISGFTNTSTAMSFGYNPYLSTWSPFHGAIYAVIESVAKIVATGGDYAKIRLTLQEYFETLGNNPAIWGKPLAALLGALWAQTELEIPAIGGKDSMSGRFMDLTVPPTLVSFALDIVDASTVISPEFKADHATVMVFKAERDELAMPNISQLQEFYRAIYEGITSGEIIAAQTIGIGGIAAAITKMALGNEIGFKFADATMTDLFVPHYGSIIVELADNVDVAKYESLGACILGCTTNNQDIIIGDVTLPLGMLANAYTETLEHVFPTTTSYNKTQYYDGESFASISPVRSASTFAKPRVLIPTFPGTNCEYDSARSFEIAGGTPTISLIRNLTPAMIEESIENIVTEIKRSQIIMIPGGFSGGDEPDGSGKFIASIFRNPRITEAVREFLQERDGLMLGICNGFQALIKLGLLPYGDITDLTPDSPTLSYNDIGRHVSTSVLTKVSSKLSVWLSNVELGEIHRVVVSHGEGRFCANQAVLESLKEHGQIATQYVDELGRSSMNININPNGSMWAIEGITSPDGRIFGKMAHSERIGENICKNVPGNKDQRIFEAGINYFK